VAEEATTVIGTMMTMAATTMMTTTINPHSIRFNNENNILVSFGLPALDRLCHANRNGYYAANRTLFG
jgi:hypothetical protein